MGKAKLVASSDPNDGVTSFSGAARLKAGISPAGLFLDRPDLDSESPNNLLRSATVPPVMPTMKIADGPRSAGLERSRTTPAPAPASPREIGNMRVPSPQRSDLLSPGVARSNTQITPARPSPNAVIGGPLRSVSIRKPGASPSNSLAQPKESNSRLTEFYDNYIDSYGSGKGPASPPPTVNQTDQVGSWARSNANTNYLPNTRTGSRSASNNHPPPSSYQPPPSSYDGPGSGGSLRKKVTRRNNPRASRIQSTYEEEEEGYVSGEYDDGPFDLTIIRIKFHYQDEIRGMTLSPETPFAEFMDKVATKFQKDINALTLKFKDEDGGKVTLRDDSDYELAIETARESSKGKSEGKLEIWCADV